MNISRAISSIKQQYGLYFINLPFDDPTENVIMNILQTTTIPIYSQYVPYIKEFTCSIRDLRTVNKYENIYMLPSALTITPVMYVVDVSLPIYSNRGAYGDIAPAYGISKMAQGVAVSQAHMMVMGKMRAEPTFEYLGENKIRLYGFPPDRLTFKVACEHDENGESIPPGCYDSFLQLANLDVKMFLYNNLKFYDNIPTAHGNINLKIDDYASAEADKKALLDEWSNIYHVDIVDFIEFM